ncbi:MAG: Xylose ABC transporter, permease protein XylH [uncultured Solirubrobacteraceae bacterium]|uniref:Xylose transport system permease protein XylH n=1 Tax=uncultured Solirubrobacteraceae bacterium TaxID=1162706 RepID=A0A6J4REU3_9ACTN|nr:MAG: Xylose ABC transporter, permease protein XylH [uncultured Solirubrobacteraceae bacterium]
MSTAMAPPPTPSAAPEQRGLGDYARERLTSLRQGELGSLPIIIGLVVIAIIFQTQNDRFLTAGNFVNLIVQSAAIITIAMGVVWVLLLGEIDLSIGYVSGVAGVLTALLLTPDGNELPTAVVILLAIVAGAAIGTLHGLIITRIGIPSFVVTLAGLLAWNGVVLLLIGSRGTVILQDEFTIGLANEFLSDAAAWLLVLVCVGVYAASQLNEIRVRRKAGLDHEPVSLAALRIAGLALVLGIVVYVVNQDRGLPYVFLLVAALLLFWTFVLQRTRFGRKVFAVGGNAEAARRAGIDVNRIRVAVFAISSSMAAIGGIILASRLRSVDTNAGGGSILLYSIAAAVIGGTSLFGGRGTIKSALLGALVIASIDNGLGLLGLGSGEKFVITGGVLLLAVTVDSLSRRAQAQSGRA